MGSGTARVQTTGASSDSDSAVEAVLFPVGPTATNGTKLDHGVLANGDGTLLVYKTGYAEVPLESCDG